MYCRYDISNCDYVHTNHVILIIIKKICIMHTKQQKLFENLLGLGKNNHNEYHRPVIFTK